MFVFMISDIQVNKISIKFGTAKLLKTKFKGLKFRSTKYEF